MYVGIKKTGSGFWGNIYTENNNSTFILMSNKSPEKPKIPESFSPQRSSYVLLLRMKEN